MNLGATLYVKNSVEAVEFYIEAFRMILGYNAKNSDGSFLHAELLGERNQSSPLAKTTMRKSFDRC